MAALSAAEAEIYDRQIRLWGVDSQRRMQDSTVLLAGAFRGVLAEVRRAGVGGARARAANRGAPVQVAKNLILAGVKLHISDTSPVAEVDTAANFFLRAADVGAPVRARAGAAPARWHPPPSRSGTPPLCPASRS